MAVGKRTDRIKQEKADIKRVWKNDFVLPHPHVLFYRLLFQHSSQAHESNSVAHQGRVFKQKTELAVGYSDVAERGFHIERFVNIR